VTAKDESNRLLGDSTEGRAGEDNKQANRPHNTSMLTGERSVAAGGDIINSSIFTGDITIAGIGTTVPHWGVGSAPPRPPLVLGREEALRDIKSRLNSVSQSSKASIQVITAVRGWPGVGKTTLAALLAHDPEMETAFPHGVLWISLGKEPSILSLLAAWGRELGTNDLMNAQSIAEASAQLTALLRDKQMLLIIDDVWEAEHAKAFMVGGRGCAMLFTTRSKTVAQTLAPTANDVYKLPVLSEEAAIEIISRLAPSVIATYPEACKELVQELDYLPLALQVAGHLLNTEAEYGFDVTNLLTELREGARLLEEKAPVDLTDLEKETTPTIAALLRKSTDHLDQHTCDCFAYLGVFAPEPASFDLNALKFVWQVEDPAPVVRELVKRGLLEPAGSERFQMHAVLVMHARSYLT
jgi:hypothetical protein